MITMLAIRLTPETAAAFCVKGYPSAGAAAPMFEKIVTKYATNASAIPTMPRMSAVTCRPIGFFAGAGSTMTCC